MEIEVVNINIEDIGYGECFKFNDDYWIKSNLGKPEFTHFECVSLKQGNQRWFKAGEKVEKVQAVFRIHA